MLSKSSTLTRTIVRSFKCSNIYVCLSGKSMTFDQRKRCLLEPAWHRWRKSGFFWIKSSAKRAFGECLGSKRRWKTWYSAISHGELRISFDPWISEWGNPPECSLAATNRVSNWFPFLRVLRCFSSPGLLLKPYVFRLKVPVLPNYS